MNLGRTLERRGPALRVGVRRLLVGAVALVVCGCDRGSAQDDSVAGRGPNPPAAIIQPSDQEQSLVRDVSPTAAEPPVAESSADLGARLYAQHCAACHGEQGDGNGVAAPYLFPRPRDFGAGRFRLVSTDNNVPTHEDLRGVLVRGMPGSSMPPWAHLQSEELDALIEEVMRLRREGARAEYVQELKELDGLSDEELAAEDVQEEIEEYLEEITTPGGGTDVPEMAPATEASIARGKEVYVKFACASCHGDTGRGDGVQEMFDAENLPTSPRDFTLGIFKGDPSPESLYRRIAYGMPGTPMPNSATMPQQQMIDLVHYVRSLSTEDQRHAAIARRETIVASQVDRIPEPDDEGAWSRSLPVQLKLIPLWWRNDPDPHLTVRAVHDGETIAVRLSWQDATADEHAVRSESFEDAVAMQLYCGETEPFLGMGDGRSPVDVWFWDADRQSGPAAVDESYPDAVVDMYPFSEAVVQGAELARRGARMADQPEISLPALASGNPIVPTRGTSGGTTLQVGGPGSVTFRAPQSQLARAHGSWSNGRWTVVLSRSLSVPSAEDGVVLAPGDRVSVAFAVWDGAHRDRDGQKLITIWQDLRIE